MGIKKQYTDVFSYKYISSQLFYWEKMRYWFLNTFKKNKVHDFLINCYMNKLSIHIQKQFPNWYNPELKALDFGFATMLYKLLTKAYFFQKLFEIEKMYTFDNLNQDTDILPFVEIIFHTLYSHKPLSEYPFTLDNLAHEIEKNTGIANITKIKQDTLTDYFSHITEGVIQKINNEYSDWMSWKALYHTSALEFLRRFNPYVSINDNTASYSWNPVTLVPLIHYLEDLLEWVYSINFNNIDVKLLYLINDASRLYNNDKEVISNNQQIEEEWNDLIDIISTLKDTKILETLLQIAYKDPNLYYEFTLNDSVDIFHSFKDTLVSRISTISSLLLVKVVDFQIKEYITTIEKKFSVKIAELGVYTQKNSVYLQNSGLQSFRYHIIFSIIPIWLKKFVNSWLKDVLNYLLVNDLFAYTSHKEKFDMTHRKIQQFSSIFNNFLLQVDLTTNNNIKLIRLLEENQLTENNRHFIKVLTYGMNLQADIIMKDFKILYYSLYTFAEELLQDFKTESRHIVTNVTFMHNDMYGLSKKLESFIEFNKLFSQIISLNDQEKSESK